MMERRKFFSSLFTIPIIASGAKSAPQSKEDGPSMWGQPICSCGNYMLMERSREGLAKFDVAWCGNRECPNFEKRFRITTVPMERA